MPAEPMHRTCFTPRSARAALDRLEPTVRRMCRLYRAMQPLKPSPFVAERPVDPAYFELLHQLQVELDTLRDHGAEVRDIATGTLDFPAVRDGRPVLLCWRIGEASLAYWHEHGDGFAGRHPVDDDGPWEDH